MATRASRAAEQTTATAPTPSTSVPSLARGASGPSLGSVPLLLRPGRGPWTWCLSAARLGCRNGRIVPMVVPAYWTPGLSANVKGDGGQGYIGQLKRQGYVEIPHDFLPAVAFGEDRAGSPDSTYLNKWQGVDLEGRKVVKWADAWWRPLQLGHVVESETDAAGRDDFLIQALIEIANGGKPLGTAQIRIATQPVIRRIEQEANRASERSRLLIQKLAGHLPVEHYTDSVRQILRRQDIEVPEPPAKSTK